MMRMRRTILAALVIAGTLVMASPSQALCLLCSCSTTASGVAFNTYDPLSSTPNVPTGTVSVSCSVVSGIVALVVAYDIQISTGNSGSYATRWMLKSGTKLNYNLYTNSGRSIVWGDGTGGSSVFSDTYLVALGPATKKDYTVYGGMPVLQNVPTGLYNDSVIVTVIY